MKRFVFLVGVALLVSLALNAQDAKTLLKENPERLANIHHSYEPPETIVDTPAPDGYEPFYLSHYGRHGSRYHTSMRAVLRGNGPDCPVRREAFCPLPSGSPSSRAYL